MLAGIFRPTQWMGDPEPDFVYLVYNLVAHSDDVLVFFPEHNKTLQPVHTTWKSKS